MISHQLEWLKDERLTTPKVRKDAEPVYLFCIIGKSVKWHNLKVYMASHSYISICPMNQEFNSYVFAKRNESICPHIDLYKNGL